MPRFAQAPAASASSQTSKGTRAREKAEQFLRRVRPPGVGLPETASPGRSHARPADAPEQALGAIGIGLYQHWIPEKREKDHISGTLHLMKKGEGRAR
jgi:hypothetical protein